MWRLSSWRLSIFLVASIAAGAEVGNFNQTAQSSQTGQPLNSPPGDSAPPADAGAALPTPTEPKQHVTITAARPDQSLPRLPPDEFNDCINKLGHGALDPLQATHCALQIRFERKIVIETCTNRSGNTAPPRAIEACTELLDRDSMHRRDHDGMDRHDRSLVFAHRAAAYVAQGDMQHALDDYNEAIGLAPTKAYLYQNRGVVYSARSDDEAAFRDFDTAIRIDSKDAAAFRQRAKIYEGRGNYTYARADFSEAIGLQPQTAALWSERGYACLLQHDYESAIRDETRAIQLDPKLARAYFLRGAGFGGLGNPHNSLSDIEAAVRLDPALERYVTFRGEDVSLTLPPF